MGVQSAREYSTRCVHGHFANPSIFPTDLTLRSSDSAGKPASTLSLAGALTSIIFVATNTCWSPQNTSFVATKLLSRQNYVCVIGGSCHKYHFCRDKTRLLSPHNFCRNKHNFVRTKVLWRRAYLSRQYYVYRDKYLS